MALQAITLSIDPDLFGNVAKPPDSKAACGFCGGAVGPWAGRGYRPPGAQHAAPACALCSLPQHLERPHIDDEATLVWLPEISQPALNATLRGIHIGLRGLGEGLHADAVFRTRSKQFPNLYYARAVIAERRDAAEARLGTASPRELGLALLELSPPAYGRRWELLEGLRLLPSGRFFANHKDVYPEIVDFWRSPAAAVPTI
jgi:hypothetical protein